MGLLIGLAAGAGARFGPGDVGTGPGAAVTDPEDPAQWLAWAERLESREERTRAERAYRTAAAQGDATGQAALRIGFLAYADGRDDEAERWLRQAQQHGLQPSLVAFTLAAIQARRDGAADPDETGASVPRVRPTLAPEARAEPEPEPELELEPRVVARSPDAGVPPSAASVQAREAPCTWPLVKVGGGLGVELELEGVPTVLLYDTGASATLITMELADAVRAELDYDRVFRASTANGRVELPTAEFFDVLLAGRQRTLGRVAVCETCLEGLGAGGLFGLDLQRRFGVELNLADRQLVFRDCGP